MLDNEGAGQGVKIMEAVTRGHLLNELCPAYLKLGQVGLAEVEVKDSGFVLVKPERDHVAVKMGLFTPGLLGGIPVSLDVDPHGSLEIAIYSFHMTAKKLLEKLISGLLESPGVRGCGDLVADDLGESKVELAQVPNIISDHNRGCNACPFITPSGVIAAATDRAALQLVAVVNHTPGMTAGVLLYNSPGRTIVIVETVDLIPL